MSRSSKGNDGLSVADLIDRAGPGHLAEIASCAVGIWLHERARHRAAEVDSLDELTGTGDVDEEADAELALAVVDGADDDPGVSIPDEKRRFVQQLRAIRQIARSNPRGRVRSHVDAIYRASLQEA